MTFRTVVAATPLWLVGSLGILGAAVLVMLGLLLRSRRRLTVALARARTDALTGVGNRAAADDALDRLVARAHRSGRPVAAVLVDVDHFKAVNDEFGHATGDAVLRRVAQTLSDRVRAADVLCRWGGEEFLVLAADTDVAGAAELAEGLRQAVRRADPGDGPVVTASFGVAAGERPTVDELVAAADAALYQAKDAGRDRVEVSDARHDETAVRELADGAVA